MANCLFRIISCFYCNNILKMKQWTWKLGNYKQHISAKQSEDQLRQLCNTNILTKKPQNYLRNHLRYVCNERLFEWNHENCVTLSKRTYHRLLGNCISILVIPTGILFPDMVSYDGHCVKLLFRLIHVI